VIVLDTSGLLAAIDASQPMHSRSASALTTDPGPFLLSPFVFAELDYMLSKYVGQAARMELLDQVVAGAYSLEPFSAAEVEEATDLMKSHEDLRISLADSSVVVIARRRGCRDLLTLDERHFRVLPGPHSRAFRLLPSDS
jgi:predicted nucleic acid-binding protein